MTVGTFHYRLAADTLKAGGVIAYPTESVIGVGCDPTNASSILRLLAFKYRPVNKGLILIASSKEQLEPWVNFSDIESPEIIFDSWPGPETWLIPKKAGVSSLISGEHETIAVRVSSHPQVINLCNHFGGAVISTSANIAKHSPKQEMFAVRQCFSSKLDYYLPGKVLGQSTPTRIRDGRTGHTIRA